MTQGDGPNPDLQAELDRLRGHRMNLEAATKEIEHEGRRTRDGLERSGGRSRSLEQRAKELAKIAKLNKMEMADIDRKIDALRQRLKDLMTPDREKEPD